MAFPTIESTSIGTTSNGTSHVLTMPAGIQAGELLILCFATDGDNTITNWDGFIELDSYSYGTVNFFAVGYKIAIGSDTCTIQTSVGEPSSYCLYRISGHECDTIPPEITTRATGSSANPDPPSLDVSWIQDDTLWIACSGCDRRAFTGYPTNYNLSQIAANGGAAGDCGAAAAGRNVNGDNQKPATFTIASADTWIAHTVGVPPDGATLPAGGYSVGIDRGINRGIL